ncbi:uncharacterized protein LOC143230189 isoform X2 [Tachypleus tridentatus]
MDVVHEGWLIKSPPEKRLWKAKWRQRWFSLRQSGQIPGQYFLEYYTDTSCRKLKGKIDLDQCEQVDVGLNLGPKKSNYRYMFDIRTPKRTYYLAAETAADMNKWVDCICSVCGLKIDEEEDFQPPAEGQPSQNGQEYCVTSTQPTAVSASSTPSMSSSREDDTNPYIPISECISGKPVLNGSPKYPGMTCEPFPGDIPPPPPKVLPREQRILSGEFYDIPRSLNLQTEKIGNRTSPDPTFEEMYKVPPLARKTEREATDQYEDMWSTPPQVNWSTYPRETPDNPPEGALVSQNSSEIFTYDNIPVVHNTAVQVELVRREAQELAEQLRQLAVADPLLQVSCQPDLSDSGEATLSKPPPRPPKPPSLREKQRYENVELTPLGICSSSDLYDIPPSAVKGVISNTTQPFQVVVPLKAEPPINEDLSPSLSVPLPSQNITKGHETVNTESHLDDMYDFPKMRSEDSLNVPVPPPASTNSSLRKPRRHAYTNAPPGLFNGKETVFNYEYRPSLVPCDGYLSMDTKKPELYTEMSRESKCPASPSQLGMYANIPTSPTISPSASSFTPPIVNRDLKPKRKTSDTDNIVGIMTLAPPPPGRIHFGRTKRSFRKLRAAPSPTPSGEVHTPPPLPSRLKCQSEHSTSDDDFSSSGGSRRNSATEEGKQCIPPAPYKREEDIQYLDLALESDSSIQSPRSPERTATTTVYKTVDFIKTKAFNEMRQNVEETYRKSQ